MSIDKENMRKQSEMLVISLIGADIANDWWNSPNRAFQMQTPENTFDSDPEKVYSYLVGHALR
jgi:hypothetical protein